MALGWFPKRGGAQPIAAPEPEQYVIMPKALRMAAASLKGHAFISDGEATKVLVENAFPISAALVREGRLREVASKRAEEEALKNPRTGQLIADRGIYLGVYEPKDRSGRSLNKKSHAFAMPEDLKDATGKNLILTFNNAAKEVGKLRNRHGHDGLYLENDTALDEALKNGSYRGQWIIPPRELLHGKDVDGNSVAVENLLTNKDKGAFAGTFTLTDTSGSDGCPDWYWSLTEHREDRGYVWGVRLSGGNDGRNHKDGGRLACRPVRLELIL